jgi:dihydrofolate reductase
MESKRPAVAIIVAHDENKAIGFKGDMPWRLSADLKRFKQITMGHPVIMGRKTFESLPKGALPGRKNIVVTRNPKFAAPGVTVAGSPEEAIRLCPDAETVFIIGGGNLYRDFLHKAELLYITLIHQTFEADTWFPDYHTADYIIIEETQITDDNTVPFRYSFITLELIC